MIERRKVKCEQYAWPYQDCMNQSHLECKRCTDGVAEESDADHIERLNEIIEWLAGYGEMQGINAIRPINAQRLIEIAAEKVAARIKAAEKAVEKGGER